MRPPKQGAGDTKLECCARFPNDPKKVLPKTPHLGGADPVGDAQLVEGFAGSVVVSSGNQIAVVAGEGFLNRSFGVGDSESFYEGFNSFGYTLTSDDTNARRICR